MWYHPSAYRVGIRDVIGAWILCLAVAALFFAPPAFDAARGELARLLQPAPVDCAEQAPLAARARSPLFRS
jgi:hypothetical protein